MERLSCRRKNRCTRTKRSICASIMIRVSLFYWRFVDNPCHHCRMLVELDASHMTNQAIPAASLSGLPVSRWLEATTDVFADEPDTTAQAGSPPENHRPLAKDSLERRDVCPTTPPRNARVFTTQAPRTPRPFRE